MVRRASAPVAAMAQKLAEKIKKETGHIARIEGLPTADYCADRRG